MSSNRIGVCVSQQLQKSSIFSFFQSALLRRLQPFSVMPLSTKCKHSYKGVNIKGAATVPSPVARSPYLRFGCCLFYHLITEADVSHSAEVGSAEDYATLLSDAVFICI